MSPGEALRHLLEQRELAVAASLTAVAVLVMVLAKRHVPVLVLGGVTAVVGAQHPLEAVGTLGVAVLIAAAPPYPAVARPAEALFTPIATGAIYLCTPDTERSIVLLGALAVLSPMAVSFRIPWARLAAGATGMMAWIAVADGRARDSAVVAALAIALLHACGQRVLRHHPRLASQVAATAVGTAIVLALSRWAGLVPDLATAGWRAAVLTVPAVAVTVAVTRRAESA